MSDERINQILSTVSYLFIGSLSITNRINLSKNAVYFLWELFMLMHCYVYNAKKRCYRFGQVKYNSIHAFGENNESGIRRRQVPVWRGLISIVLSVINLGPNNFYGIVRIPVCTGSGMYRLHCTYIDRCVKYSNLRIWITQFPSRNRIVPHIQYYTGRKTINPVLII